MYMTRKIYSKSSLALGISIFVISLWSISSCTYENIEPNPCNSNTISYAQDVDSIIQQYQCTIGCHTGSFPAAGPNLDSYELVKESGLTGDLLCAINWTGCTQMPLGGLQLDSASRSIIEIWISEGACP